MNLHFYYGNYLTLWNYEIIQQAHADKLILNIQYELKYCIYIYKYTDESNNKSSFVASDVSIGTNECWLRGGDNVSPSLSAGKEPSTREL